MSQTPTSIPQIEATHVTSKDDFHVLVEVEERAFTSSEIIPLIFPLSAETKPGQRKAVKVHNHQEAWSTDPSSRYFKACLPDGKIVGFAKWKVYPENSEPEVPWWETRLPLNANKELCAFYFGGVNRAREEAMKQRSHFKLVILAVLPEYQRMGVGSKLLGCGLQEADREGVECWIDSSPFGLGLYMRFGWQEVGGFDVDLGKWGGEEGKVSRTVYLVRQPQRKDNSGVGT
jgi:GNAT superfamily N-acetyltransferase